MSSSGSPTHWSCTPKGIRSSLAKCCATCSRPGRWSGETVVGEATARSRTWAFRMGSRRCWISGWCDLVKPRPACFKSQPSWGATSSSGQWSARAGSTKTWCSTRWTRLLCCGLSRRPHQTDTGSRTLWYAPRLSMRSRPAAAYASTVASRSTSNGSNHLRPVQSRITCSRRTTPVIQHTQSTWSSERPSGRRTAADLMRRPPLGARRCAAGRCHQCRRHTSTRATPTARRVREERRQIDLQRTPPRRRPRGVGDRRHPATGPRGACAQQVRVRGSHRG